MGETSQPAGLRLQNVENHAERDPPHDPPFTGGARFAKRFHIREEVPRDKKGFVLGGSTGGQPEFNRQFAPDRRLYLPPEIFWRDEETQIQPETGLRSQFCAYDEGV